VTGARSRRPAVGRVQGTIMQDTRDGRRKNQVVRASAPKQFEAPRRTSSISPRRDGDYKPATRSAASRPTTRPAMRRPAAGAAVVGDRDVRRKPDNRPWPSTRKSAPGSKGPGVVPGYGARSVSSVRPATRSTTSRPTTTARAGRPAPGAFSGRPETKRKPAPRSWPGGKSSDSRRKGAGYQTRSEGYRPSSGPRPNKSTHTGGRGPGRGKSPGSRGPGRGAGNRGPRR
jgi:hypothetical protein